MPALCRCFAWNLAPRQYICIPALEAQALDAEFSAATFRLTLLYPCAVRVVCASIAAAERDHQALLDRVQLRHAAHRSLKRALPEGHGEVGRRQQPNIHLEL